MTTPLCGYSCLTEASGEADIECGYGNYACDCALTSYQQQFAVCISEFCDASDIHLWTVEVVNFCNKYGVAWPTSEPPSQVTGAPATGQAPASTITVTGTGATPTVTVPGFLGQTSLTSVNLPSSAAAPTSIQILPTSNPTPSPDSQSSSSGLSTGAIAGISVGVVAIFVFAVLAFLLWHRGRRGGPAAPTMTAPAHEGFATDNLPLEKDGKATATVTAAAPLKYTPEINPEHLKPDPNYQQPVSPLDPRYQPPLSPSPAYTEIAGAPAPVEVGASKSRQGTADAPVVTPGAPVDTTGFIEADSRPLSHNITSPASELEDPSFMHYELPIDPPLHAQPSPSRTGGPPAQELALSSPAAHLATVVAREGRGEEGGWGAGGREQLLGGAPVEGDTVALGTAGAAASGEDPELARMKAEIEQLRAEKEREMRLMSMEARERELSRKIVEKELSILPPGGGGGGGSGSGSGSGFGGVP